MADEHTAENGRHERAEGGTEAERNGHAEGKTQEAHGQAERQPADTPQKAEKERPKECALRSFGEDGKQVSRHEVTEKPGSDDPAEETANQPIGFPGPAADAAIRHVETTRSQPT